MRKSIVILLLIMAGIALLSELATRPLRSPFELKLVSSKHLEGKMNGKEFMQTTLVLSNRGSVDCLFQVAETYSKVKGRWTEVAGFGGAGLPAGGKFQGRLVVPSGAEAIRLRFNYQCFYPPPTWMAKLLRKLGPFPSKLVAMSPWLAKRVWPSNQDVLWKETTLEVKITPTSTMPVGG